MNRLLIHLISLSLFFICTSCIWAENSYNKWVAEFKTEAESQGIRPDIVDNAFKEVFLDQTVLKLDRKQPEASETFTQYLNKRLPPKLKPCRREIQNHKKHLMHIQEKYSVPASLIVALWGMETEFGKIVGNFDIINALTTLAYDGRRRDLFKNELIDALKIIQNEKISMKKLKGSWAGALGQCQFMPSTYNTHAVDEDQDGMKDIWHSHLDIFASMANYLTNLGWESTQPWGYEVYLPESLNSELLSPQNKSFIQKSTQEWSELGVRLKNKKNLPQNQLKGSIIRPDSKHAFLVYDNFFVIFQWNRSFNFALTVLLLTNKLES